jgi:hypothetical protein
MVVVDNARKMIGKTIDIAVTSVLQTTAGKMIFGKWDDRGARQDLSRPTSGITPIVAPPVAAPLPNGEPKKAPVAVEKPLE